MSVICYFLLAVRPHDFQAYQLSLYISDSPTGSADTYAPDQQFSFPFCPYTFQATPYRYASDQSCSALHSPG
jgi:hypothetical protein